MVVLGTISPFVIAVLKYAFIALVYFFVYRAIRSVGVEVAGGRRQKRPGVRAEPRPRVGGKA
jgi:hypothetical protein